ncbi:MAG TPA: class I mannose-6-phosphate isomerase [Candidatus Gallacutalibacter stercoravium]|nr:class I mannose-6-phosphate isomerase [Candidatus Gallacutalibacter stercoravium]
MYPMKLTPACKDYLWGGTRLKTEFGKVTDLSKVAESWELSCHKDGPSTIANGPEAGKLLTDYIEEKGKAVLGTHCEKFEYFPILIKLIDAKDNLSVQVHPDNDYALRVEGEYGKTEMWYIVDCEPGAQLLYGFKNEISTEEFRRRIADNTLLEVTNSVPVHKGDVFFIDAGTLHAIGKGILIAEIQQNSNTTYRIYDYGRVGADGKPRQLHVDKAVEVTRLQPPTRSTRPQGETQHSQGGDQTLLASCDYFTVNHVELKDALTFTADETSFHSLLCLEGSATLQYEGGELSLGKGESVFVPANTGSYTLRGACDLLLTTI